MQWLLRSRKFVNKANRRRHERAMWWHTHAISLYCEYWCTNLIVCVHWRIAWSHAQRPNGSVSVGGAKAQFHLSESTDQRNAMQLVVDRCAYWRARSARPCVCTKTLLDSTRKLRSAACLCVGLSVNSLSKSFDPTAGSSREKAPTPPSRREGIMPVALYAPP